MKNKQLMDELMRANGFDESALAANRMGKLVPSQKKYLVSNFVKAILYTFTPLLVLVYLLFTQKFNAVLVAILIIMAAVISAVGFYAMYRILVDLLGNQVLMVEGIGKRKKRTTTNSKGRRRTNYYYSIGEKDFLVKRKAFDAFENGARVRAYYTTSSNELVNIEIL